MSAIDELFSGVAEEQKSGSEIVREQTGHVSDNNIACAEEQFTHLFAFVFNVPTYSSKIEVIENITNSLEYVFENLKALIDIHSTVKPNFSLAYNKSVAKFLEKELEDESKSEYHNLMFKY